LPCSSFDNHQDSSSSDILPGIDATPTIDMHRLSFSSDILPAFDSDPISLSPIRDNVPNLDVSAKSPIVASSRKPQCVGQPRHLLDLEIVPTSDQREIDSIETSKGKERHPGERQPGPLTFVLDARLGKTETKVVIPDVVATSDQDDLSSIHSSKGSTGAHDLGMPIQFSSIFDPLTPVNSSISSLSSSAPIVPAGYRKRRGEHARETDEDEGSSRKLKRLRRPSTPVPPVDIDIISLFTDDDSDSGGHETLSRPDMETISLSSDDDISNFIVQDSDIPSSPPAAVQEIRERIRGAIRALRKDPLAQEKSPAQMDALIAIMTEASDLVITMKTGGGKSILWMVPSILEEDAKSIVISPFVALLHEQCTKTSETGLRCHNFGDNSEVPNNVQVLFVQVEHCASNRFTR
jgi:hypothetical protein